MNIVISVFIGLIWGLACSLLNYHIMKKAVSDGKSNAVMAVSMLRTLIDAVCLGAVFLLRNVNGLSFVAMIVAAAAGLSITTIYFTFRLAGRPDKDAKAEDAGTAESASDTAGEQK